jgi:hypothetical protein
MKTYICFNDESGSWNDKNLNFYIRASLLVDSTQLKKIENDIVQIRDKLNLRDLKEEIKWQDLWQLRKAFKSRKIPKGNRLKSIFSYIKKLSKDYHLLIEYCKQVLSLLQKQDYDFRIILTFTEKNKYSNHKEADIYKFHIQDHLQRIQMQNNDSIVIIVYDGVDNEKKKQFKEIHKEIIKNGDFIKDYKAIYNSLLFDDSYDNKLLQMVDFIAGCFSGTLTSIKKNDNNNYQKAREFFNQFVYSRLCKTKKGEKWGAGILEVPTNNHIRNSYKNAIS